MTRGFAAAGLVVVLANGAALAGVAYNRAAVVERVELTERELPLGYTSASETPTSLRFDWATLDPRTGGFTEAQLRAAGFDLPPAGPVASGAARPFLPRRAAVVFEVGGAARDQLLANFATHGLPHQVPPSTELVLVDIGRDLVSMRAAHPDVTRTLVLWGEVQVVPGVEPGGVWAWYGQLVSLEPASVHVSRTWRSVLIDRRTYPVHYVVTLAVGRRGEPWIESARIR